MRLSNLPLRLTTGAYILHSGYEKWGAGPEQAQGMHGMASGAFPPLATLPAPAFAKGLAVGEMAVGAMLLAPMVSPIRAGVGLTAFSGALLTMYSRTPGMRKPGSPWPTPEGIGLSKDVWMSGAGLSLILGGLTDGARKGVRKGIRKGGKAASKARLAS